MLKVTNGWNIYIKYNTFFLKFIIIIKHDFSSTCPQHATLNLTKRTRIFRLLCLNAYAIDQFVNCADR